MKQWGMETGELQIDDRHPTGRVTVELADGEPSYDIVRPCAWDAIEVEAIPAGCGLLYHGTLAARQMASASAGDECPQSGNLAISSALNMVS